MKHDLWPDGDYDEFARRLRCGQVVVFENGRWWRRGFDYATLIDDDKPFLVRFGDDPQQYDYTHAYEPQWFRNDMDH